MCSIGYIRNGILLIGRGLAYHKMEETDLLRSKRGLVDRQGCGVPQNGGNRLVLERCGRNGGLVHREGCGVPQNGTPRDIVHLHRRRPPRATVHPPSTSSSLHMRLFIHGLLFIQPPPPAPPPATVQPALSTGSCSTTPPRATVHPALHGVVLFIQPSTGSCSSTPQLAQSTGVLFIQRQHHGVLFIQPPTGNCSSKPTQQRSLFIKRKHQSASVSSSREGIDRSSSVRRSLQCNRSGSIRAQRLARVQ